MFLVSAFYHFHECQDYECYQQQLKSEAIKLGVKGSILLASEGINGTVAGAEVQVKALMDYIKNRSGFSDLEYKISWAEIMPFKRMKVRLKQEIVRLDVPEVDSNLMAGAYVEPEEWNDLISDQDAVVIDTRNDYETAIGMFKGASDPQTNRFRHFPDWVQQQMKTGELDKSRKIAMYCTGGIRCEKATAYMRQQGFDQVYHLKGGILKYLEKIEAKDSLWQGDCFVFDQRISVDHNLKPRQYDICYDCGVPFDFVCDENSEENEGKNSPPEIIICPNCLLK